MTNHPTDADMANKYQAERDMAREELARVRGLGEALANHGANCAADLESEIEARRAGELPRRIERDLQPVRDFRAALAAWNGGRG